MRVPLTYAPTGERVHWTVWRDRGGWVYRDHEGYERNGGASWPELVDRFHRTAENYNMDHRLS